MVLDFTLKKLIKNAKHTKPTIVKHPLNQQEQQLKRLLLCLNTFTVTISNIA